MSSPRKKSGKSPSRDESPDKTSSKRERAITTLSRTASKFSLTGSKKRTSTADVSDAHGDTEHDRPSTLSRRDASEMSLRPSSGQFGIPTMDQEELHGPTPAVTRYERVPNFRGFGDREMPPLKRDRQGKYKTLHSHFQTIS